MGYEYRMIVGNMGSIFLTMVIWPIVIVFLIGLQKLVPSSGLIFRPYNKYLRKRVQNYLDKFFWKGVILFIDQCYLVVSFMAMINLTELRFGSEYSASE